MELIKKYSEELLLYSSYCQVIKYIIYSDELQCDFLRETGR